MKKQKVEKVNLPYASSVASYFGDQGVVTGNSFLGRMFKGNQRTVVNQAPAPVAPSSPFMNPALANNARTK